MSPNDFDSAVRRLRRAVVRINGDSSAALEVISEAQSMWDEGMKHMALDYLASETDWWNN